MLALMGFAAGNARVASTPVPSIPTAITEEPVRLTASIAVAQPAPPPAPSSELLFVFRAGGNVYVKLSDDEPKHGKRVLADDADGTVTVAAVKPENLPAKLRGFAREALAVDGNCTAHVTGFAVVTRMLGTPGYAGLDDEHWNVDTASAAGTSVLAARLDGCKDGVFARRASLAPIATLAEIKNDNLAATARAALIASDAGAEAQVAWSESGESDKTEIWSEHAEFAIKVLRHPTTGVTWVTVHASIERGCGGPDINAFGLFRVDAKGALRTVVAKKLTDLYSIERVIDVDNDGRPELIGKDWLGLETILAHGNGEPIDRLEMKFHGCPC